MHKEVFLLGVDKAEHKFEPVTVCLLKVCPNGAVQVLDLFKMKEVLKAPELEKEIDKVATTYERLYSAEIARISEGENKWYSHASPTKINVNNQLIEQLKKLKFN
jgi:hypothetical protein